ncbi:hypothetical protein M514_20508, partial [Trichuris suis]
MHAKMLFVTIGKTEALLMVSQNQISGFTVSFSVFNRYYCSGEEDNCGNSKRELHGADVSYQCLE